MGTVGAYQAKTHLAELLDRVQRGETITITRRGAPVADLVPCGTSSENPASIAAQLRRMREGVRLDGLSLREMIDEGRR